MCDNTEHKEAVLHVYKSTTPQKYTASNVKPFWQKKMVINIISPKLLQAM